MARFRRSHPPLVPVTEPEALSPKVSVIIPARDEENNIALCLEHLLKQSYPHYDIVVVDDRSNDRTPEILKQYPVKIVRVEKVPEGWTGKNYAMFTGSKAASGEWLLFTDADTIHSRLSLQTAVTEMLRRKLDCLTLAPEIQTKSFWEKVVQPLAVGSLALWFETDRVNDPKNPVTLANGQFILIKKEVYERVGGNESVKDEIIEDVALAKRLREAGFVINFLNGTSLYSTRMYKTLREIHRGWTRIYLFLFEKRIFPILHKLFLFLFFSCLPFVILIYEIFLGWSKGTASNLSLGFLSAVVCLGIVGIRFLGNRAMKSDPWFAFFHFLGSVVMAGILLTCVFRICFNKPSAWRGSYYR
jgi:glycosyltransferase involved in cell wall biosynthesis